MLRPTEVHVGADALEPFAHYVSEETWSAFQRVLAEARARMVGRTWWNVSSTARGGGVAEMLASLLRYGRGAGVDARWLVIEGTPDFFHVTKRLHHALHGSSGDGSPLGPVEHALYDEVLRDNLEEMVALVRPGDVVLLHDPQTAGLAPALSALGAQVAWRCHIGSDRADAEVARGWSFLLPPLAAARATVFTRPAYVPAALAARSVIIRPSIDIFSVKNQDLEPRAALAILAHTGLLQVPGDVGPPCYRRHDGVLARVDRCADLVRNGPAPTPEAPLVVQVSRWDPLKDPAGVMEGFAHLLRMAPGLGAGAHLVLAGPSVTAVADDPEAAATFADVTARWQQLPHAVRARVHLACLPMADLEENAAIVNALQRRATVIVQKSLEEGFGLTVTEAMWKGRPVVASAVGGIQDQLVDGEHGLLLQDPRDLEAFARALRRLLEDPPLAERLGQAARRRVLDEFTVLRHFIDYAQLLVRLDAAPREAPLHEAAAP
ncbi:glycosyltransferase [Aggregicoccus sp. 17bor-14]|uniref:glycosyltransferase n=1 Tax=Myxococcaceae TaxID=31 RepID=UPI00129C2190|nr:MULTISPECIES: glycosyltransferase [Myxococcaceae]MBF5045707.1 glycosyltransferase [Simulacricoccus sp. 17bor-14]MRI91443.1 glycosyltransferase [Aggregicoccus sp. 17bor-14]